jgi:HK97 family phage portal protein
MAKWFDLFRKKTTFGTQDILRLLSQGYEVKSGVDVSWRTAVEVSTVLRCAAVISDSVATIPLRIYKKKLDGSRVKAEDHELYYLFDVAPNSFQTTLEFRETLAWHLVLTGNAYAYKNVVRSRVRELIPIEPSRVLVAQNADMSLSYKVTFPNGDLKVFEQDEIWHLRGPSWGAYVGDSPVYRGREAIGLGIALERSHAAMHKNGVRTTGAFVVEDQLKEDAFKRYRAVIEAQLAGVDNAGRPLILDHGAKFIQMTMSGIDAQHLETRKFQIEEICRVFGVLPIMVGYSDKTATYASAEQMFLAHAVHTARPWHRRLEASINSNLIGIRDLNAGYYSKFVDTELLRGAAKDRADYYASGITAGWLTRNEAREFEELNPLEGLDEPIVPLNMASQRQTGDGSPTNEPSDNTDGGSDGI